MSGIEQVNLHDPFSPAAEEYRKLKNSVVELSKGRDQAGNAVLVTSAIPGEGKSLTALNLAITLAQELDHSVLLVDADLRDPALHRYLDMEPGSGLSDVLQGRTGVQEATRPTGMKTLSVLQAGHEVDNPAELLTSARMRAVIDELKQADPARFVIFDTPPVLPFAETRALARMVDGVLFVIMERVVARSDVIEALEALKGARLLGAVYNAADLELHRERFSHYDSYYKSPDERLAGARARLFRDFADRYGWK